MCKLSCVIPCLFVCLESVWIPYVENITRNLVDHKQKHRDLAKKSGAVVEQIAADWVIGR